MKYSATTTKTLMRRGSAVRKARVALATTLVAAGLVLPPLAAGLVAPPAHASTTFLVTKTSDSGTGSLRQAIVDANSTAGADAINFAIPKDLRDPSTGVATISPLSPLPQVTETVTLNGYSQQDSAVNTLAKGTNAKPLIELDGTNAGSLTDGLEIAAKNTTVKGLVINRFGARSIALLGGPAADGARIEGNFVGTNPAGTQALPNHDNGVLLSQNSDVVVGGATAASRNLISGNRGAGVVVFDGNLATDVRVRGNLIGTDKGGTGALGNGASGVTINTGVGYSVVSNTIAFNGSLGGINGTDGIFLHGDGNSTGNRFLSNSIFANVGLGIALNPEGPNTNDAGDTDSGPNGLQNKPGIGSAKTVSGKTTIKGTLNSRPGATYTVQFFSNPSGNEGKKLIGQRTGLAVDGTGHAAFTFSPSNAVSVGQTITATATNEGTHDTSEFSAPRAVASS